MRVDVGEKYDFDNGGLVGLRLGFRFCIFTYLKAPEQFSTDNNGLGMTIDVLEEIYTNPDFPKGTPDMEISLAEGGKSRADLWAFAALVAAEWGIERNNHACAGIVEPGDKDICQHIQVGAISRSAGCRQAPTVVSSPRQSCRRSALAGRTVSPTRSWSRLGR